MKFKSKKNKMNQRKENKNEKDFKIIIITTKHNCNDNILILFKR